MIKTSEDTATIAFFVGNIHRRCRRGAITVRLLTVLPGVAPSEALAARVPLTAAPRTTNR